MPDDDRLHTVAQLARRVGLSDGRVRAMLAKTPDLLPVPDEFDADGHPLWRASTIDPWGRVRTLPRAELVAAWLAGAGWDGAAGDG